MKKWINNIFSRYLQLRCRQIEAYGKDPRKVQEALLIDLIRQASNTDFGQEHGFEYIRTSKDFAQTVPIRDYHYFQPHIDRMMHGVENVLWPGKTKWFAKSSGTTGNRSKYIPVTPENLKQCHIKSSWDATALLYKRQPAMQIFVDKSLVMGGSLTQLPQHPETIYGDVSAIMTYNMPRVGRPFYTPDFETALMSDWQEKIEKMAHICSEENVIMFGGVPTWTIVLFNRMMELKNVDNMLEVWPNVQAYMHGGVGFEPYRKQFEDFIPKKDFIFHEIYNASEGFFAAQDRNEKDMLLFLNNGVYYEFLPVSEWTAEKPVAIPIWEVEEGQQYAIVLTSNSGIWRYTPGDTVTFTSVFPHRIQITGRMQQYINAFGEEVVISNADQAIASASREKRCIVREYTVAPIYLSIGQKGRHQWLIEFEKKPLDMLSFAACLDDHLRALNSDYDAKRTNDLALECLEIIDVPEGTFHHWLKSKNKLGGQHKVPRLRNDRKIADEILAKVQEDIKAL